MPSSYENHGQWTEGQYQGQPSRKWQGQQKDINKTHQQPYREFQPQNQSIELIRHEIFQELEALPLSKPIKFCFLQPQANKPLSKEFTRRKNPKVNQQQSISSVSINTNWIFLMKKNEAFYFHLMYFCPNYESKGAEEDLWKVFSKCFWVSLVNPLKVINSHARYKFKLWFTSGLTSSASKTHQIYWPFLLL